MRGARAFWYIFFETLPSFLMGLVIFLLIILMFQVLRLTEFSIVHGVDFKTISEIILYVCISMLPVLLPMSLLFSIILSYGRLSQESELIALRACGLSMYSLVFPSFILAFLIAIVSAQVSFSIAPWGNRQFEVLYTQLANTKAAATIKPGTFAEGFFDMVVYANEVDSESGKLKKIFIFDEKDTKNPLTIVAKSGQLIPDPDLPGHAAFLRLEQGDIHKKAETHTKIHFQTFDVKLVDPVNWKIREKSPQSLTFQDLQKGMNDEGSKEQLNLLKTEWHKRIAISVLCFVFALIGVGLGTQTNRRNQKSNGLILSIGVIVAYWIFYVLAEGSARSGNIEPYLAIWAPNLFFGLFGIWRIKKVWD